MRLPGKMGRAWLLGAGCAWLPGHAVIAGACMVAKEGGGLAWETTRYGQ